MQDFHPSDGRTPSRQIVALGLLWLAGAAMRIPLLAVPPVIPLIHDDLHLTETQVGLLIGMPLMLFAAAAIPGSLLIARYGASAIAIAGLFTTALAAASRAAAPDVWLLYAATVAMGFGVAIIQPALPTLVREWTPRHIGLGTAMTSNGLLVGVTLGPALSIPLVLPLVGQSWRLDFLVWAAPVLIAALLFLAFGQPSRPQRPTAGAVMRRWWPDWRSPLIWLLGITFGCNNAFYYGFNAFLPDYLTSVGRADLIGTALGWLNGSQLIASFVLLATAERLQRRTWPYLVFGPLSLAGLLGVALIDGIGVVICASVVGFSLAVSFVVTFALPPVLSPKDDVHRLAGGMFTISYTIAVVVPVLCGAFWDFTGIAWTAFLPLVLCGVILTALGFLLSLRSASMQPGDRRA
jgi:MFS transporter, CP family, cyanate transporter